jgi:hypothetical protein
MEKTKKNKNSHTPTASHTHSHTTPQTHILGNTDAIVLAIL